MDQYLTACRHVIKADLDDPAAWGEVHKYLIGVRQSLTCCVCGGLLNQPTGPARSVCFHYVCKRCVGMKMRYIKHGCGWCKSFEEFVPNRQLECVARCFRQLCAYVRGRGTRVFAACGSNTAVSGILAIVQEATGGSSEVVPGCSRQSSMHGESKTITQHSPSRKLQRGRRPHGFIDDSEQDIDSEVRFKHRRFKSELHNRIAGNGRLHNGDRFNSPVDSERILSYGVEQASSFIDADSPASWKPSRLTSTSVRFSHALSSAEDLGGCDNDKKTENFVLAEHDYNKFTSEEVHGSAGNSDWTTTEEERSPKRTTSTESVVGMSPRSKYGNLHDDVGQLSSVVNEFMSNNSGSSSPGEMTFESNRRRYKMKGKLGCRCALATPNPGKLTCCGQRCPCYAAFKGCDNCKCRGCRNPRGDPDNVQSSLMRVAASSPPVTNMNKMSTTVT